IIEIRSMFHKPLEQKTIVDPQHCLAYLQQTGSISSSGLTGDILKFNTSYILNIINEGLTVLQACGYKLDQMKKPFNEFRCDKETFIAIFKKFPGWCDILNDDRLDKLYFIISICGKKPYIDLRDFLLTLTWLGKANIQDQDCTPAPISIDIIFKYINIDTVRIHFQGFYHAAFTKSVHSYGAIIYLSKPIVRVSETNQSSL